MRFNKNKEVGCDRQNREISLNKVVASDFSSSSSQYLLKAKQTAMKTTATLGIISTFLFFFLLGGTEGGRYG